MSGVRVAADIGGTFTDVVLDDGETRYSSKVLTTYKDPADAVLDGLGKVLREAGREPSEVVLFLHGTTLATNALIERRGARTALLTTEGHRDALEMAFENRFEQYDVNIDRPAPLVPRHLRLPVRERLAADGEVLIPLDGSSVAAAVDRLAEQGVESVAIGLLHGYRKADHEQAVAEAVRERLPGVAITLACEVCPEIREFERLSTACANAYVQPLMASYLQSLESQLIAGGVHCPVLLMTSGGGLTDLSTAARFPIRLVESGPAGGAILAADIAARCGLDEVLSLDMGGTTAKICLIDGAEPQLSRQFEVGPHLSIQERIGAAHAHSRHRNGGDRGGRRFHRVGGRPRAHPGWARERRLRAGPGLLWPGRAGRDGHGCRCGAGQDTARTLRGRLSASRQQRGGKGGGCGGSRSRWASIAPVGPSASAR